MQVVEEQAGDYSGNKGGGDQQQPTVNGVGKGKGKGNATATR